jgi:hypothetical protein
MSDVYLMYLISFSLTKKKPVVKFPEGSSGIFLHGTGSALGTRRDPGIENCRAKAPDLVCDRSPDTEAFQWLTSNQPGV